MDITTVNDEALQDLFEAAFEVQVASYNNISEYEASIVRETASKNLTIEVTIYGLAGSPTPDNFKDVTLKNIDTVIIEREDKGSLRLNLVPKETISLNTNDYVIVYKSV